VKWLPALILLLGVVVFLAGFVYDVLFAGIPYQDPTPELAVRYAFHSAVAGVVYRLGAGALGAGAIALAAQFIFSRLKR